MDFGDVIFFLVFVGIIISNILKHLKKVNKQEPGKETSGIEKSEKKSGWKNVLEQMLEEARKQMENPAEPDSAGSPLKHPTGQHPTGWEDIITGKSPVKRQPEQRPERTKTVRAPVPPIILDDLFPEKTVIAPERSYRKVEEKRRAQGKIPTVDILPAGKIKIPRQMSQADLRTAVVWSEILGKPLGLRDIEG